MTWSELFVEHVSWNYLYVTRIKGDESEMARTSAAPGLVTLLHEEVQELLRVDLAFAPIPTISQRFGASKRRARNRMVTLLDQTFRNPRALAEESDRVLFTRLAVAFAPESANTIKRALRNFQGKLAYELHFSLFCFLDQSLELNRARSFATQVPEVVARYLQTVPRQTALAAWMAGDLLGDHMPGRKPLSMLCAVAVTAKYAAGRLGAIHGLQHIVDGKKRTGSKRAILTLSYMARTDKNPKVRKSARLTLKRTLAVGQPSN
jgi:phytoene dehydrogenase-like protein